MRTNPEAAENLPEKRVVIVDPDEAARDIFGTILGHHGYVVSAFEHQLEALKALPQLRPELVIVAFPLGMPDGRTLLETIRAMPELAETKILSVSAEASPDMVAEARRLGSDEYCTKPVGARRLAVQVRDMVGPSIPK